MKITSGHFTNLTRFSFLRNNGFYNKEVISPYRNLLKCKSQKRSFFNFNDKSQRTKNYARRELVGYSMDQMYSVVADVKNYNKFVPFCTKSLILKQSEQNLKAEMVIGFPPINERYTSHVTMSKPFMVKAECLDGRLFNHLLTFWRFSPGLQSIPQSCVVDFQVSFEFKSTLHSHFTNLFFDKVVLQMESAFTKEANKRYGKASIASQVVKNNDPLKI